MQQLSKTIPITREDLLQEWSELKEIIEDGDMTLQEFEDLCPSGELSEEDFETLYYRIEDLFEEEEEETEEEVKNEHEDTYSAAKDALERFLQELNKESYQLPCGLDCPDPDRARVAELIAPLDDSNCPPVQAKDILGEWNLLYTSSRTMSINKSLSGLGRSSSERAHVDSIRQIFKGNQYWGQVTFLESFRGDDASFDVTVVGEWMLEQGRRRDSTSLRVDPESITYALSKNDAKEWASLGPIKLLDFIFFDGDMMILRGNANTDALFVYKRVN